MAHRHPSVISKAPPKGEEDQLGGGDVLSGEDYPELRLRVGSGAAPPDGGLPADESDVEQACRDVEEGRLQGRTPEACQRLLAGLLELGRVAVFAKGAGQLMEGLESDRPLTRRWALETIRALATQEDLTFLPHDALPLFLGGVGRCLVAEPAGALRDLAVECAALLVGAVASTGDLEGAQSHLARILRDAGVAGPELRQRILASTNLGLAPLRLYFREGRSVLESRVLPLFRMAGPDGARGLIRHLEAEGNRHRRSRILEILKALAPLSSEPVKESLEAGAWYLVRNALNLLGELGDPDAFEAVSPFLEHGDPRIRRAALRAFWKSGGTRAESQLVELLPRCDPETQGEILVGLTQIRARSAVIPIARLTFEGDASLRIPCIEALGRLAQPEAIPTLARLLERKGRIRKSSESPDVREAAAKALVAIGTPEAMAALALAVFEAPRNGDQEALERILERRGRG